MTEQEKEEFTRGALAALKPGEQLFVTPPPAASGPHRFLIMLTNQDGIDTGRPRYMVACTSCSELLHEATTGPLERVSQHRRDKMTDEERAAAVTFDQHRAGCAQCKRNPYDLCDVGARILIAEPASPPQPFGTPLSTKDIARYVAVLLRTPCEACGGKLIWRSQDVVCPKRYELARDEAQKHSLFPVDTGPFSLGRRVD